MLMPVCMLALAQEMQEEETHSIAVDIEVKAAELNRMDRPPFYQSLPGYIPYR